MCALSREYKFSKVWIIEGWTLLFTIWRSMATCTIESNERLTSYAARTRLSWVGSACIRTLPTTLRVSTRPFYFWKPSLYGRTLHFYFNLSTKSSSNSLQNVMEIVIVLKVEHWVLDLHFSGIGVRSPMQEDDFNVKLCICMRNSSCHMSKEVPWITWNALIRNSMWTTNQQCVHGDELAHLRKHFLYKAEYHSKHPT